MKPCGRSSRGLVTWICDKHLFEKACCVALAVVCERRSRRGMSGLCFRARVLCVGEHESSNLAAGMRFLVFEGERESWWHCGGNHTNHDTRRRGCIAWHGPESISAGMCCMHWVCHCEPHCLTQTLHPHHLRPALHVCISE